MKLTEVLATLPKRFSIVFPTWFWSVLALCFLHRLIAVRAYYYSTFRPIYNPGDDAIRLWVEILGESTFLGITYDVIFAALFAAFFVFIPSAIRFFMLILLAMFLAANADHIDYNNSNITLSTMYLGVDATFIKSMLTSSLIRSVVVLIVFGLLILGLMRWRLLHRFMGMIAIPVIALAIFLPVQGSFSHPTWLQSNPLLGTLFTARTDIDDRPFSRMVFEKHQTKLNDVDPKLNVLVIYMEGLSRHSLQVGDMNILSGLASQNIEFSRYITPQLITANGLFASLTGDLPYFISGQLKWETATEDARFMRDTLPSVLRVNGYHTAYLQSANLEFMSKGEIMPRMGFDVVLGRETWDTSYSEDGWGIDDRALFEHTLDYLDQTDPEMPWFVSVLTTGTHAPYNVPKDYMPDAFSDRYRALRYLDDAVKVLTDGLTDRGLLENTIIVLTSDESRERSVEGQLQSELALNWLPLIVMHPSRQSAQFDNYISTTQLPQILISLQKDDFASDLVAMEESVQPLVFGNVYSRRFYWFEPQADILLACETENFVCAEYDAMDDPVTALDREPDKVARYPFLEQAVIAGEPLE